MENKEGVFPLDTRLATPDYKWSFSIWNADNVVMHKTGSQGTVIQTMAIAKEVVPAEDLLALGVYGFNSLIREEGKEGASILGTALLPGFKDVLILRRFIFSNMSCLLYFCDTLPTMKECIQALKSAYYSEFCKRTIIPTSISSKCPEGIITERTEGSNERELVDVGFEWNYLDDAEKALFVLEDPDESEKVVSTDASVDIVYSVNNAIMKESQIGTEVDMFSKIGTIILLEKC